MLFLTLVGADSTHAQLRSLAAIKHLALESSPGAERQTKGLRTHHALKMHKGLLVPTLDSVPAEDRPYFARCVVRANLPKPLSVALECYDAAGAYVGTKRAANVDRLAVEVWSAITYLGNDEPVGFTRAGPTKRLSCIVIMACAACVSLTFSRRGTSSML